VVLQRIEQGLRALFAFSQALDYSLAERYLDEKQMALFRRMAKSEQLHSLNVLRDVLAQEATTPQDLAVAALLHDAGKSRWKLTVWQKTISVLVKKFLPVLDERLCEESGLNVWTAPFVVRRHHPKWSGELLAEIGSSEGAVWLASHHAENPEQWRDSSYYPLLLRLQSADNAN
jgi:hypothetical protein